MIVLVLGLGKTCVFKIIIPVLIICFIVTAQAMSADPGSKQDPRQNKKKEAVQAQKPECTAPTVDIKQGKVCGKRVKTSSGKWANAYFGIPFAKSTAGENRFRPPVPDKGWDGVYRATAFGPSCPQKYIFDSSHPQSEDCLDLNIWVPATRTEEPRTVTVYIYGGFFLYGFTADPIYDAAYVAANGDVIVVSIN